MARAVVDERQMADGTVLIDVRGELDIRAEGGLRSLLTDVIERRRPPGVIVDLGMVTFMDSTGINVLVAGHNAARAQGVTFSVRGLSPLLQNQLRAVGVHELLAER